VLFGAWALRWSGHCAIHGTTQLQAAWGSCATAMDVHETYFATNDLRMALFGRRLLMR